MTFAAEHVHGALGLVEGHVARRDLQHDVVREARGEDPGEAIPDLLGGAGTELDRLLHAAEDPAQRSERGVGALLAEQLDVPAVHGVGSTDEPVHAPRGDVQGLGLVLGDRNEHRATDTGARRPARRGGRRRPCGRTTLDVELVRPPGDRARPHQVHPEAPGGDRAPRIPERDGLLHRRGRQRASSGNRRTSSSRC